MKRPDLAALGNRLAPLATAFDARSLRERVLLIGAATGVLIALALPIGLDPLRLRLQQLDSQRDTLTTALQQLQAETASQQTQHRLSHEQAVAELETLRQRHGPAGTTDDRAPTTAPRSGVGGLVGPDQMLPLLSELLGRQSGLRVRALQSLGQTPWPEGAASAAGTPRLFRHAVELQVEGSYADLLSHLQSLEALPQRLLWGGLTLQVEQHPRALLTLRLYTLSPRASWVEL